ncbi:hypothetical protein [Pseudoruegeria sp. HB172150]|uniref:hypothetical protein n=1 Tax=Pseudoruegeria sp. HB172150 TaxID=2721164 RepID=UPI0015538DDB|nr:hypothetical protein [Pseudoruegeria sp. HB172150]
MKLTQLKTLMTGAALSALLAGGALAQDTTTATDPAATDTMTDSTMAETAEPAAPAFTSIEEMTVGDVVGMIAYDPEGNRIAEIDYVVSPPDGAKAVLGIGGFIGLGEYTVALPLEDFQLNEDGTGFTLSTDKETLKAQPEFDESGVEGLPDETPIAELIQSEMDETAPEEPAADASEGSASDDSAMEEPATEETADEATEEPAATEGEADAAAETEMDSSTETDTEADAAAETETDGAAETEMETETEAETETDETSG